MNNDDYLKKLKDPEAWFDYAFAQKMVADKRAEIMICIRLLTGRECWIEIVNIVKADLVGNLQRMYSKACRI